MDFIHQRMELCTSSIAETLDQIKTLQSKHQQLIGYRQALSDIINDFESQAVSDAVDSIATKQKPKKEEV